MSWRYLSCCLLLASLPASLSADLIVQGYNSDLHDRFAFSPLFIGDAFDWSGVGRLSGGGGWATMISSSYFLSATHSHPGISTTVRFHETNDPGGVFHDYTVASGSQIAGSDLWLGRLTATVASLTKIYPVLDSTDITGQTVYVFGQDGTTGMRLGRNVVDAVLPAFSDPALGATTGDVIVYDYDNPGGLGVDEAFVQGGDSGGPVFQIVAGQPAVVGIHWFNYVDTDPVTGGVGSGDTFVSSYIDELNSVMIGESVMVVVPEPSSLTGLLLFTLIVVRRYRHQDQAGPA